MELTVTKASLQKFNSVYEDMLLQFPKEELKPQEVFKSLLEENGYTLWLVHDSDKIVAYFLVFFDAGTNFLWLDYLAVFKEFHSLGYGSKILRLLHSVYPDAAGCFLEVEKENPQIPNTIRRIQFYERRGAVKLPVQYFCPTVSGNLPMYLFYLPIGEEKLPSSPKIKIMLTRCFDFLYGHLRHSPEVRSNITVEEVEI